MIESKLSSHAEQRSLMFSNHVEDGYAQSLAMIVGTVCSSTVVDLANAAGRNDYILSKKSMRHLMLFALIKVLNEHVTHG